MALFPSMMVLACVSLLNEADTADDSGAPQAPPTPREELRAFGGGLKAAVQTGVMSREEAWSLWEAARVIHRMDQADEKSNDWSGDAKMQDDVQATTWYRVRRLSPPRARQISQVLEPEFLTRDALLLHAELDLEEEQALIVDMVLEDYAETFDALTAPLIEMRRQWDEGEQARRLQAAMHRLDGGSDLRGIDLEAAAEHLLAGDDRSKDRGAGGKGAGTSEAGREKARAKEEARREHRALRARQLVAMNDRLGALRSRMQSRLDRIEAAGGPVRAADVLHMLEQVASRRALLRRDVEEMLALAIVIDGDEIAQESLERVIGRLDVDRGAHHARFGGEGIVPERVLGQVFPEAVPQGAAALAEASLLQRAQLVRARTETAVAREVEGWRFMIERESIIAVHGDEDDVELDVWVETLQPFGVAWTRELAACRACRDGALDLVESIEASLLDFDAADAGAWHDAAMRAGFALEMRPRWSERATAMALAWDDLTDEQREAIGLLQVDTGEALRGIRDAAIARRILRDPELASSPMVSFWGDRGKVERPWTKEDWAGFEYEAHGRIEEQTRSALQAMLDASQFERLPPRRDRSEGGKK